jgi:glucose/arabinose dehydrogenase
LAALAATTSRAQDKPDPATHPVGSRTRHEVVALATGLSWPWSLRFLPDGSALITERTGGLRLFKDGLLDPEPVTGLPDIFHAEQGGVLGLEVDPAFDTNHRIYLCITIGNTDANASAVVRSELAGHALTNSSRIFVARPRKQREEHYGCRLLFAPDGTLLMSIGDGYHFRDRAQSLQSDLGKVIRIRTDGSIPADNPFRRRADALPEIYTLGHRNMQGMALRPGTREIWVHEHGPRGGDEVNVLRPGANYGWPKVTFGIDYSGESIAEQASARGFEAPRWYWVPSIAPSGMTFYDGSLFPEWRGDLFIGAMAARSLRRLDVEGGHIVGEEILLAARKERVREVQTGPDGCLYVLTDEEDGKLLRIQPPGFSSSAPH